MSSEPALALSLALLLRSFLSPPVQVPLPLHHQLLLLMLLRSRYLAFTSLSRSLVVEIEMSVSNNVYFYF